MMNWRFLRLRRLRRPSPPCWGAKQPPPLRGYLSILSDPSEEDYYEDDDDDRVCLLTPCRPLRAMKQPVHGSTGTTGLTTTMTTVTTKQDKILSWWRRSVRKIWGWSPRHATSTSTPLHTPPSRRNDRDHPAASITTSPTTRLETPPKDKRPFIKARPTEKPLYYIISDVGNTTYLGTQQHRPQVSHNLSPGLDEDKRRNGPMRSLGLCFERKRNTDPSTPHHPVTEHDTLPMSHAWASRSVSASSMTSTSEDMPPPILRSFSFDYPSSPIGRASGIVPGNVKFLEAQDTGPATRELIRILTIPPLLPFRALQRDITRPDPPGEEPRSTLGISCAHPHWIERGKRNVWDDIVVSDSFFLDDSSIRPPPIHIEPCTSSRWLDEMFSDASSNSVMTGLDKIFVANNKENRQREEPPTPMTGRVSPLEWMIKLYQPMLRATKYIPVCGHLGQVVFDDAPFDEVKDDNSRVPLGEVRNKRPTQHKPPVPRPLKPCPKDTPSIQQVYLPRNSPWENFK